jgi:uncharacterized protein with PIN domain
VIVADTSALIAILLDEPEASRGVEALAVDGQLAMTAGAKASIRPVSISVTALPMCWQ